MRKAPKIVLGAVWLVFFVVYHCLLVEPRMMGCLFPLLVLHWRWEGRKLLGSCWCCGWVETG